MYQRARRDANPSHGHGRVGANFGIESSRYESSRQTLKAEKPRILVLFTVREPNDRILICCRRANDARPEVLESLSSDGNDSVGAQHQPPLLTRRLIKSTSAVSLHRASPSDSHQADAARYPLSEAPLALFSAFIHRRRIVGNAAAAGALAGSAELRSRHRFTPSVASRARRRRL